MKSILVAVVIGVVLVALAMGNPVAQEKTEEVIHDLEPAEHLLVKLIEKKIVKLFKKCLKLGGCQTHYGHASYGSSYEYGHGYDDHY